ncbi:hypothetical protein FA95DRAFT_1229175 [Auriscalpium vulgare]|uniref:Uncharacterized protein n=1 Tax=Auriscalpium vulgare TaxID=40419 RepID=A0ACB8R3C4_9AGAM|nr:hypothetical protein FA95DRAFT_1229175 [Auriscalpium vulgare]
MFSNPLSLLASVSPALVGQSPKPSWALPDAQVMRAKLRLGLQDLNSSQRSARSRVKWAGRRIIYQAHATYRKQRKAAPVSKIPSPCVVVHPPELPVARPASLSIFKQVHMTSNSNAADHLDVHEAAQLAGKTVISETARFPIRPSDDEVLDALTDAPKYPMWRPPVRRTLPVGFPHQRHEEPSPALTVSEPPSLGLIPNTDCFTLESDDVMESESVSTVRAVNVLVNGADIESAAGGHSLVGRARRACVIVPSTLKGRWGNKGLGIWVAFPWSD